MRRFAMGRYGLKENPVGLTIRWTEGPQEVTAEVTGCKKIELCGAVMAALLTTRLPTGQPGPDVSPRNVWVVA